MEKFNKDQVYVINRPDHPIVSIVISDWIDYPFSSKIHKNLFKLSENTDVIFIFSDNLFSSSKKIMKGKFTSLYQGCSFLSSSVELPISISKILMYCKEIFNHHLGYLICNGSSLDNLDIDDKFIEKVLNITNSSIIKPIYELRRLSESELYSYYSRDNNIIKKNNIYNYFYNSEFSEDETSELKYCSWTTDSNFMYLKNGVVNKLLYNYGLDSFNNYARTFTSLDFRYFLSNFIKISGIDNLNMNLEDYGETISDR